MLQALDYKFGLETEWARRTGLLHGIFRTEDDAYRREASTKVRRTSFINTHEPKELNTEIQVEIFSRASNSPTLFKV